MAWIPAVFNTYPFELYLLLALFFLAIGSFLNVIIYRLPLMLEAEWQRDCCHLLQQPEPQPQKKMSLSFPRSFCTHCHTTIPAWHNIPILSFCLLHGRCHFCKTRISMRYPLIELLCLCLSLLAVWQFGFGLKLVFVLLLIWILIAIFFIDLNVQIIPDSLSISLLWLGLFANTQTLFTTLPNAVFSAAAAYLCLWLFIKLYALLTGKIGMGNGDFKLFAAFGAWFGATILPFILIFSAVTGALIGSLFLFIQKKGTETPIPFGPFLCTAALISLFIGHKFTTWYCPLLIH
jgi:leader peptidase (prepilin peptidase)/N-methyltransferase